MSRQSAVIGFKTLPLWILNFFQKMLENLQKCSKKHKNRVSVDDGVEGGEGGKKINARQNV